MSSSSRNILPPLADILPPPRSIASIANMGQRKSKSPSKLQTKLQSKAQSKLAKSRSQSQSKSNSSSQESSTMSAVPCFHQSGKRDADVDLLSKKGVWIGSLSWSASRGLESFPKSVPSSSRLSNFYCNSCLYGRSLQPVLGSFIVRTLLKDGAEVTQSCLFLLLPVLIHNVDIGYGFASRRQLRHGRTSTASELS